MVVFLRWGKFHLECTRKSHSKQLRQSLYHLVSVFCNIGKIFLKIKFYVYVRCNADFNVIQFWALGQAGNFYTYSKNIMLIFWLHTKAWWETKILPTISNDLNQASLQKLQKNNFEIPTFKQTGMSHISNALQVYWRKPIFALHILEPLSSVYFP